MDPGLGYLHALSRSPNTIESYAYDLRAFVEFLAEVHVDWQEVDVERLARFVRWLEQPAGNVALLHFAEPARARATVARAVNAVHSFYDYQTTCGVPVGQRLASFSRVPKPH